MGNYLDKEGAALLWDRSKKLVEGELYEGVIDTNGYDFVDMGEAGIWATCNIGANSPKEYGLYFAWGETEGYASFSAKEGGFDWETAPYWVRGTSATSTKWSKYTAGGYSSDGRNDNKSILEPEDDAAHVNMGGDWRMPTQEEFQKLVELCDSEWITQNEANGFLFTLKTDSSKQLFFPAAGFATATYMSNVGMNGCYWSSSLYTVSYNAYNLHFCDQDIYPKYNRNRYLGLSIRGFIPPTPKSPKYLTKQEASETFATKEDINNIESTTVKEDDFTVTEMRIIDIEDSDDALLSKSDGDKLYQSKLTPGTGIEITEDNEINVTLDTKVFKVVESLPDVPASGDENKIHLKLNNTNEEGNTYDEYLYVDGSWELIGQSKVEVDLSDYYTKEELKELVTLANEWKALKAEMAANPNEIVAFVNGELIPICNVNSMILTKPTTSTLEINNIEENEE